jgi:hypothetical protein
MSRNDLSVEEMLQICNNWLDETSPANAVLRKHPELKLMIPKIQSVASALSLVTSGNKPTLAALVDKAHSLDADHDRVVRGLFGCFNGLIELEGDSDVTNLRDWMFPDGLSHTTASYQAEAGHASKIQSEMTSDKKKLLQAIKLHGSTALDYVVQWFGFASELGTIEQQRVDAQQPTGSANARKDFFRVARGIENTADLLTLAKSEVQALLGVLQSVSKKSKKPKSVTPPAPTPPIPGPTPAPTPTPAPNPTTGDKK